MKHNLLLTAIAIISSILPITANAQDNSKKTKTSKTDSPQILITTQNATTEDGRKALLKSDGTWQYMNNEVVLPKPSVIEKSSLKFETGLVLRSGDVKPISRKTFFLLDKSFASIMIDEDHTELIANKKLTSDEDVYALFLMTFGESVESGGYGRAQNAFNSVMSAIKPHVIQTVTTDFSGKATLDKLPAGTYWLMGFTTINKDCIIWDIKANLSPGENSLILDQHNSGEIWNHCILK